MKTTGVNSVESAAFSMPIAIHNVLLDLQIGTELAV